MEHAKKVRVILDFVLKIGDYGIRKIEEKDLEKLLEWRNSDRIHSMMLTNHKITWQEHKEWFLKISKLSMPLHFIFYYKNNPIGFLGYNDIDVSSKVCHPSLYLGELDNLKANAGIILGKIAIKYAFENMKMHKICVEVLENNTHAYKLNLFLGYKNEGILKKQVYKNGKYIDVILQGYLKEEW